jgi:crossover junction endodeoxyribonuclease RusA
MIAFEVEHRPVPQGSLTPTLIAGRPGVRYLKADELYEWRAAVARACPIDEPEAGAYHVVIAFRLPRPKSHTGARGLAPRFIGAQPTTYPDLDKLVRGVLDALTGRVWIDDSQVVQITARKLYADGLGVGASIYLSRADGRDLVWPER